MSASVEPSEARPLALSEIDRTVLAPHGLTFDATCEAARRYACAVLELTVAISCALKPYSPLALLGAVTSPSNATPNTSRTT